MAYLGYYGSVTPSEFEEMDPSTTHAYYLALRDIVEAEHKLEVEKTKALMRAMGAVR